MKITAAHSASSCRQPVILSDDGSVMDYATGVRAVRQSLALSTAQFGASLGVSARTVENWEQGRIPNTTALLLMATLLA